MAEKITLSKKDRMSVAWRSTFIQGSWNYERMQNGGWCYAIIPAIKKLYKTKEDRAAALKRHLEFFNTHPYIASPIMGVTLALEEERANGAPVDDVAIQGVKVGMMGPLAGVGDPVFWFTVRPMLGALGASLALTGSIWDQSFSSSLGTLFVGHSCGPHKNLATKQVLKSLMICLVVCCKTLQKVPLFWGCLSWEHSWNAG